MPDKRTQHKEIPLSGKWYTSEPATIGENFQTLTNLRYTDTHIKGVGGMTKINVTAMTTAIKTRSAFHFKKSQPAESHVLAQVRVTATTTAEIKECTGAIPTTAAFTATAIFTENVSGGLGRFCDAPDGQMMFANGIDTCIWGGNEMKVGAFITSTAAITDTGAAPSPKDYTDIINNTKTDGDNVAIIGGGIDTYTKLMMHMDGADAGTTFTDSVGTHTPAAAGDAQTDTAQTKFGISSGLFDGTGDYVTIPDHADWFMDAGTFTIDFWVRFNAVTYQQCLYSQATGTNYIALIQDFYESKLYFATMLSGGGGRLILQSKTWAPSVNTWYHIAVIRGWGESADDYALVIDGTFIGTFTDTNSVPNLAASVYIGSMARTTDIDFGNTGHEITFIADATLSTTQKKWGNGSLYVDGVGDMIQMPDHADWDIQTNFTIDLWVKHTDHVGAEGYVSQVENDNNSNAWWFYHQHGEGLKYRMYSGGALVVTLAGGEITDTNWHHVALCKVGDEYGLYLDGVQTAYVSDASIDTFNAGTYASRLSIGNVPGTSAWPLNGYVDEIRITHANSFSATPVGGLTDTITVPTAPHVSDSNTKLLLHCDTKDFSGWIDEFRVSKGIARWTANFTPPARPYSAVARTWLVGSPRPLQGLKYTVSLANSVASIMTGSEWNGTTWNTLTLTDNTDTGASLAATGTVTFTSTVLTAKPKYLEGYFLYWYQFAIDAGGAEISHVTLDAPFQGIVDMWDGIFRDVVRFYKYTTVYLDNTTNVLLDDYDATAAYTFSELDSMAAFSDPNNALIIGFTEKMTGLKIDVAPEQTNSTAATTMAVDYHDGTDFVSAGTITDGTSEGAISLAKSGVVSWNNNSLSNETRIVLSNSPPLYYYRVRFDKAMDATVQINYVGGISAQKAISHYKFPVFAQGRILLCGDMAGEKNKALVSGKYMPQVYNGVDSVDLYFGEEGELTCGTELFSQFGSSLYSLIIMFKDNETWVTAGQDINQWENNTFLLSSTIGCPAALTLKTINLHAEPGTGINRALAIWQGTNGIYMSDGRAPIPIHGDIKEFFDRNDSRCIKASMVGDSVGFIDPVNQTYHWLFASGTAATTLNKELVYDIARNKWFEIDRTADLQCGIVVHDTDGNAYNYGFLDTGYMERLEYGNDFDGTDIIHTFQTGDMAFAGLGVETRLSALRLISVQKTTDSTVTFTHYGDTNATGTDKTMSIAKSGYRVAMPKFTEKFDGDPFHSLKFTITTDDAVPGFEPLAVVAAWHPTHHDN